MITKKNILDLEARRKIYAFIQENPGLNVNKLSRRIEIPKTTLLHHLRFLEKQELIELKHNGEYKHVYVTHELGAQDKEILEMLRKKIPCRILLHFFTSPSCSQIELSQELEIRPSVISYHLKKMVKMGIIEKARAENGIIYPYPGPKDKRVICKMPRGREVFYRRKNQKIFDAVGKIMIAHKDSLTNKQYIDEYFSYYQSLAEMGAFKQRLKNSEKKVIEKDGKKVSLIKINHHQDKFYEIFTELFRPPFCA